MMQEIPCRDTDPDPYLTMSVQVWSPLQGQLDSTRFGDIYIKPALHIILAALYQIEQCLVFLNTRALDHPLLF